MNKDLRPKNSIESASSRSIGCWSNQGVDSLRVTARNACVDDGETRKRLWRSLVHGDAFNRFDGVRFFGWGDMPFAIYLLWFLRVDLRSDPSRLGAGAVGHHYRRDVRAFGGMRPRSSRPFHWPPVPT
jgi:hypothetical protein